MTGDEAIAEIQAKIGFRSDLSTTILSALKEAQKFFEKGKTLPRFLIEEDATLTLVAEQNYLDLPTGFIKLVDDDHPAITLESPTGLLYLKEGPWDSLQQIYYTSENGNPLTFAIRKDRIYFAPTPSEEIIGTWSYYKRADEIVGADENVWLENAPYLLIGKAGLTVANSINSAPHVLRQFSSMYDEWYRAVLSETVEWETAGPVVMGSDL